MSKPLVKKKASKAELRSELNKIAKVLFDEMAHEPCRQEDLSDAVRRIMLEMLLYIKIGRVAALHLLDDPGLRPEMREELETWYRLTNPYDDNPLSVDTGTSRAVDELSAGRTMEDLINDWLESKE